MDCTCQDATNPWDDEALDCPVHAEAARRELETQAAAERAAENAWLRAAEYDPRMDDPREW